MENRISVRKGLIFSIKTCYKLVSSHPFVMVILFSLFLLYKCLPYFVFHFLVTSSPILVSTLLLLGTLLSLGNPNYIPEFEVEEAKEEEEKVVVEEEERKSINTQHEPSSLLSNDFGKSNSVSEKDEIILEENNSGTMRETNEVIIEDESEWVFVGCEVDNLICDRTTMNEEVHEKIRQETQEKNAELSDIFELMGKREFKEARPLIESSTCSSTCENDIGVQISKGKKKVEDIEMEGLFGYSLDSSFWIDNENSDGLSDSSCSNQKDSYSSDPSVEDLNTMLEELQPLLDTQPSQSALLPPTDSILEKSTKNSTNSSIIDSEEEEDDDDDEEEEEEEEEEEVDWNLVAEEGGGEFLLTWTKDENKMSLIDLLSFNLESNQEQIERLNLGDSEKLYYNYTLPRMVEPERPDSVPLNFIPKRKSIDISSRQLSDNKLSETELLSLVTNPQRRDVIEQEELARESELISSFELKEDNFREMELMRIDWKENREVLSEFEASCSKSQVFESSSTGYIESDSSSDSYSDSDSEVEINSYIEWSQGVPLMEEIEVGSSEFKVIYPDSNLQGKYLNNDLACTTLNQEEIRDQSVSIRGKSKMKQPRLGSFKFDLRDQNKNLMKLDSILEDSTGEGELSELWLSNEDHVVLELPGLEARPSFELSITNGNDKPSLPEKVDDKGGIEWNYYSMDAHSDLQDNEESFVGETNSSPKNHSGFNIENLPKQSEFGSGSDEVSTRELKPVKEVENGFTETCSFRPTDTNVDDESSLAPKERI